MDFKIIFWLIKARLWKGSLSKKKGLPKVAYLEMGVAILVPKVS